MDEATPQERLTSAIKFIIIPMVQVCARASHISGMSLQTYSIKEW